LKRKDTLFNKPKKQSEIAVQTTEPPQKKTLKFDDSVEDKPSDPDWFKEDWEHSLVFKRAMKA